MIKSEQVLQENHIKIGSISGVIRSQLTITNNTAMKQPTIRGRTFLLISGAIVNAASPHLAGSSPKGL